MEELILLHLNPWKCNPRQHPKHIQCLCSAHPTETQEWLQIEPLTT